MEADRQYRSLGGSKGSVEAAVERALKAADADRAIPRDRAARLALLRRGLIPRGTFKRRLWAFHRRIKG